MTTDNPTKANTGRDLQDFQWENLAKTTDRYSANKLDKFQGPF